MTSPIVFMDTETTGLNIDRGDRDEIWEFAAIRREPDGTEKAWHSFVTHDIDQAKKLPEPFLSDYLARYDPIDTRPPAEFRAWSAPIFAGRPHIVGAVPDFDTAGLRKLLDCTRLSSPWHYHLIDVETLAVGWLTSVARVNHDLPAFATNLQRITTPPWDSEALSFAVGVDPANFDRHTAKGDVLWAKAIYDAILTPVGART